MVEDGLGQISCSRADFKDAGGLTSNQLIQQEGQKKANAVRCKLMVVLHGLGLIGLDKEKLEGPPPLFSGQIQLSQTLVIFANQLIFRLAQVGRILLNQGIVKVGPQLILDGLDIF